MVREDSITHIDTTLGLTRVDHVTRWTARGALAGSGAWSVLIYLCEHSACGANLEGVVVQWEFPVARH